MKRKKISILYLISVMFLLFSGSGNVFGNVVIDYLKDRALDFADIFRVNIKIPRKYYCFNVHLRATALAQVGVGYFEGYQVGLDHRGAGILQERKVAGGLSLLYFTDIQNEVYYGNSFTDVESDWTNFAPRGIVRDLPYWDDGRHQLFSLGVEAQFFFLPGIDVGIYPEEIIDFVMGFFVMDIKEDDLSLVERVIESQMASKAEIGEAPSATEKEEVSETSELQQEEEGVKEIIKSKKTTESESESEVPVQVPIIEPQSKKSEEIEKKVEAPSSKKNLLPEMLNEEEVKELKVIEKGNPYGPPSPPPPPPPSSPPAPHQ